MYIFPEILITGKLPENWSKESLIVDGLSGWACCMAGAEPPEKFGAGMALIDITIGTATPEGLRKLAYEFLKSKVTVSFFKDSGKLYTAFDFDSDFDTFETDNIIEEAKTKPDFIDGMDFVIEAKKGSLLNKRLVKVV